MDPPLAVSWPRALPWLLLAALLLLPACGAGAEAEADPGSPGPGKTVQYTSSSSCIECHQRFHALWAESRHGLAMQPFTKALSASELSPLDQGFVVGEAAYTVVLDKDGGKVIELTPAGRTSYSIEYALGGKNDTYFLTPIDGGRLQVLPLAWDVNAGEWFDTTASAVRHFPGAPDEALYWTHPAYTFNTSCFGCHVSQVESNYDLESDVYRTTWTEPGINCETCHGPAGEHVRVCRKAPEGTVPEDLKIILTKQFDSVQMNDLCAPCHAKASPISVTFQPKDRFFDHFDLVTLESADFYPDGRDLGENYTQTGWLMSPCVRSGKLDCMHCHTSSGRFRQKEDPDQACVPCHQVRVSDPGSHTRHAGVSPKVGCIDCHMPSTWFARMERHDHSMRPPTPAATLAFGSPNACNLCHGERSARWAGERVDAWHGAGSQERRMRTFSLVNEARQDDWSRVDEMLAYLASAERDEVTANSLVRLLRTCPDERRWAAFRSALDDTSPLIRASAAEALGDGLTPGSVGSLVSATEDSFRLVRIRAAAALAGVPVGGLDARASASVGRATEELIASMQSRPDDAHSHYNLGNLHMAGGRTIEAITAYETSIRLNPDMVQPRVNLAMAYAAAGRLSDAEADLNQAAEMAPESAVVHFNLGLLMGEQGRFDEAMASHRRALEADPALAAAAFNLCVLQSREDVTVALPRCRQAADGDPGQPRYAYTLAYFLIQEKRIAEARKVLEDLTRRHPGYGDAWFALGTTYERDGRPAEAGAVYRRAAASQHLAPALRRQFARSAAAVDSGTSRVP